MTDHQYFTVEGTALTIQKRGALAIYCGDAPRTNADGSTSHSLRAPLLILPPDLFEDGEEEIRKVAQLLNANAHLFFSSAAKPVAAPEVTALVDALRNSIVFADEIANAADIDMHDAIVTVRVMPEGRVVASKSWAAMQNEARAALAKWEAALK